MRAVFQWNVGSRVLELGRRTLIMGVVNVTPDSFSDGGLYLDAEKAVIRAEQLLDEGATIIDVGGESTRPGASEPVSEEEERRRVLPVIRTYISFPAGLARVDLLRFSVLTFVGALPWCAALAIVGYELGRNYDRISGPIGKVAIGLAVVVAAVVVAWYVRGREPGRREA